jgi:hypothetical protein
MQLQNSNTEQAGNKISACFVLERRLVVQLICHDCWNYTYFEVDVETLRELKAGSGHLVVQDTKFEDFNYSQSMLRDNLNDIVQYVIKQNGAALIWNPESESYQNNYISCARCESKKVTKPYSHWHSNRHQSLDNEILANHKEFTELRREKKYANRMPVLWEKQ